MQVRILKPEHLEQKKGHEAGATITVDNPEYLAALIVAGAVEDAAEPSSLEAEQKPAAKRPKKAATPPEPETAPAETAAE